MLSWNENECLYNEGYSLCIFWLIAQLLCMMLWYSTYGTIPVAQNAFDLLSYLLTPFEQFLSDQGEVSPCALLSDHMVDVSTSGWCFQYLFRLHVWYTCAQINVVTAALCVCSEKHFLKALSYFIFKKKG